jgi:hypothetical protein
VDKTEFVLSSGIDLRVTRVCLPVGEIASFGDPIFDYVPGGHVQHVESRDDDALEDE